MYVFFFFVKLIFPHFFFFRYRASDETGYVADVSYEGTIKPLPSNPKPVVVPAPPPPAPAPVRGIPVSGLPISGLPARPIKKRDENTKEIDSTNEVKRKRKQSKNHQQTPKYNPNNQYDYAQHLPTFQYE